MTDTLSLPRSIASAEADLRRLARETGARRLADLTPELVRQWVENCGLKPVTVRSMLRKAGSVFSRASLQAMGMTEVENPFARVAKPKVDHEAFQAPSRAWIMQLMQQGISELLGHSHITITASTYAGQVDQLPAVKF